MNPIGIYNNLDRPRIRKLLIFGIIASAITGVGDFLLGFGAASETGGTSLAMSLLSNAVNLPDWQLIAGSLCGLFGILLEGLSFFAVYRLMADASPKFAHAYRTGIIGYIWLAPIGCHLNIGIINIAYKYLMRFSAEAAEKAAGLLLYAFSLPCYVLLIVFWLPAMIIQFLAFIKGYTPYPKYAACFNVIAGMIPALIASVIIGVNTAWGGAVGTMFLSFGNGFMFAGLLATLPGEEKIAEFKNKLKINN